jgi:DNA-binding transcriptional LysR family regulator
MNMTDVGCFMKVAELMSFSKAAEALYISQQAVSAHIKRLEENYSVQLFERRPALKLTESGKILLQAARDIIQREEILLDQLATSQNEFYGEIAIGLPTNRATAFAKEFIPDFAEKYPNITISLVEKPSSMLPIAVRQNEIDIALPILSVDETVADSHFFIVEELEVEDSYLVISDQLLQQHFPEQYPACKTEFLSGVSLKAFANVPMFLRPSSSRLHEEIIAILTQDKGRPPFIRSKTTMTSALLTLCAQGYGIFFCAPMLLTHMYREQPNYFRKVNVFPVIELLAKRKTVMFYHRRKHLTRPLRDAIEIIRKKYRLHHTKRLRLIP